MNGKIKRIVAERGFGFIASDDGKEYFFHRSAVEGLRFENLAEDDPVAFDVEKDAPKGPRAKVVRPIEATTPAA